MEKKRKRTTIIIIISAFATVCILITLAVIFLPGIAPSGSGVMPDELSKIKYVSLSGLDNRESVYVNDKYRVRREASETGAGCLEIRCLNYWDSSDPKDWITYEVFDSAADAKKSFEKDYKFIIDYYNARGGSGSDSILNKGIGWFIADMPANDAVIHKIYFLADNVVLSAEVSWTSYMTTEDTTRKEETTKPKVTRSSLANYIKDNAADLRRFVLTEIYPGIAGAER